jgi:hypothetical protein
VVQSELREELARIGDLGQEGGSDEIFDRKRDIASTAAATTSTTAIIEGGE